LLLSRANETSVRALIKICWAPPEYVGIFMSGYLVCEISMDKAVESPNIQDGVAGICFAAVGAASIYWSFDYTGASGLYPRVLGAVIVLLGLLMVLRSMRRAVIKPVNDRPLVDSPRNFFIAITFGFFFLLLVTLIGFYTSSLLVLLTLPIALGFRRAVPLVLSATLFIVFLYVLFSLVLERPLPREFFQI